MAVKKSASTDDIGLAALNDCGWFNSASGELVPGFQINAGETVVDIGAGRGRASFFAARRGAKVIAVDGNPDRVQHLEQHSKRMGFRDFQIVGSRCDPLPIANATADKVVCMEVLEHVDDPQQIITEMGRIAKPHAEFLVTVPDPVCESVLKHVAPDFYWEKPHHIRVFGRDELEQLLQGAGLTIQGRHSGSFYHSMYWVLFWAAGPGESPKSNTALKLWCETWRALLDMPNGEQIRRSLDELMPKNQAVVARKAA